MVVAVHRSADHGFTKTTVDEIELAAGLGVVGDAHAGATVRHRSRVAVDPDRPNLRQVHLMSAELLDELVDAGFDVTPGGLGENLTTRGLDLLDLPTGAVLRLGERALVAVTGLRNPCAQIDRYRQGVRARVLGRDEDGRVVRRAGVMGVVVAAGVVRAGDAAEVALPPGPALPLERV